MELISINEIADPADVIQKNLEISYQVYWSNVDAHSFGWSAEMLIPYFSSRMFM